ncbi:30S ribosomal protein S1 isoform X3 [Ricinus communis]|uniref:30S ribosomal protein S1 isoform X3 n=1 Tax=Ricinus communis TaxID=3988 RepID=UPI00201AF9B0|nr:30S ribosomal protein S1 isoform X3 [Ricinus communis]
MIQPPPQDFLKTHLMLFDKLGRGLLIGKLQGLTEIVDQSLRVGLKDSMVEDCLFDSILLWVFFLSLKPQISIHEIARGLNGSSISVKVLQAEEESRKLIFSEKEAEWSKFSKRIKVGDIFVGRVGSTEDYGAFVHLLFPDGLYHLTGLVHVSEVSWDLVQDVRDVLNEGDNVKVKIINIDRQKSRMTLSIKQLEEDPLLETLDKVIPQDGSVGLDPMATDSSNTIEPLLGLEVIIQELLREDGVDDVRINRQGFEKRAVSQDLQLWLSNAPPVNRMFTLLARAGRQVQEIQLTTTLDQEGIKKALQRVLERVP